jgi:hypothetical protein
MERKMKETCALKEVNIYLLRRWFELRCCYRVFAASLKTGEIV